MFASRSVCRIISALVLAGAFFAGTATAGVVINGGDATTLSTTVAVVVTLPSQSYYQLDVWNEGGAVQSSVITPTTTSVDYADWLLPSGEGTKTVHARAYYAYEQAYNCNCTQWGCSTCYQTVNTTADYSDTIFLEGANPPVTAATPTVGTYYTAQKAALAGDLSTASIHYTIDGTTPDQDSPVYGGPITMLVDTVLKFFGIDTLGNSEPVQTATYEIRRPLWTRQMGTEVDDNSTAISSDPSGNFYIAGYVYTNIDGQTLAGSNDILIVKYDTLGTKLWTRLLGGTMDDRGFGVAADQDGNVYVTGIASSSVDGAAHAGNMDVVIAKYDTDGNKLWTRMFGSTASEYSNAITVDPTGTVYVTGFTYGSLDGNTSSGGTDLFVAKYDADGNKLWTRQIGPGAGRMASGTGIATDSAGNVLVAGYADQSIDGHPSLGMADIVILQYDADGNKLWSRVVGAADGGTYATGIAVDAAGNAYVSGRTAGSFDGHARTGSTDYVIVKYDTLGTKLWSRQRGTAGQSLAQGIAVDGSGNVYLTGYTTGGLDGNASAGAADIIAAMYDADGNLLWTRQMGGPSDDLGTGITVDPSGYVCFTGYTQYYGLDGNTSLGYRDIIVMKLDTVAPAGVVAVSPGNGFVSGTSIAVEPACDDQGGTGCDEVRFSNAGTGGWSGWLDIDAAMNWTIDGGEGAHTVYAQFMDRAGTVSATTSTTIILDQTAPFTEASAPGYSFATWTAAGSVSLSLSASDAGSGVAAGYPVYCVDAADICTPGYPYTGELNITCGAGTVCAQYVRYRSMDNAGVIEEIRSSAVRQDLAAPEIQISAPSTGSTTAGPVTYTVTYTDQNFSASTLSSGDVTLNATGTAQGTVSVDGGSGSIRTVTVSDIAGSGTLGISIAAGTASDSLGHAAPAAGPSGTFTVSSALQQTLAVTRIGNGYVASSVGAISCGAVCTDVYATGTPVVLTATPDAGWSFVGWSGACTGAGTCDLTMDGDRTVTARFAAPAKVGTFRTGKWYLDANRSWAWDGASTDILGTFGAGQADAVAVSGDWNADGITELGVFFGNGMWRLDTDGNGVWEQGVDAEFKFGMTGDIPVTGDWNGDGTTEVGLFRGNGYWYLDTSGNRAWNAGVDATFKFGIAGDIPVTGDWNGDGTTEVGLFRGNGSWYLDSNGNRAWNAGGDVTFKFGIAGDVPVTGDWNADGTTEVGVFRGNGEWFIDEDGDRRSDRTFRFGIAGDAPMTGNW